MTLAELNIVHPVGSIFETLDSTFNPGTAWGGTWSLDTSESVLVSKSELTSDLFNTTVNTTVGSNTAVANLPNHTHTASNVATPGQGTTQLYTMRDYNWDNWGGFGPATWNTDSKGSGSAHENRMRSMYVLRWIRTA